MSKTYKLLVAAVLLTVLVVSGYLGVMDPVVYAIETDLKPLFGLADAQQPNLGNPVVPGFFADPSVHYFNGAWYIYCTTDSAARNPVNIWKSTNGQNWEMKRVQINGYPSGDLWAPAAAAANGKFYLYYSHGMDGMYVAEAASPEGPFTEKAMLFDAAWAEDIDPQPFQDTDGTWYLYFGGSGIPRVAKLNSDMISFAETPKTITINGNGGDYEEGPFMIKRNGYYMLTYSGGFYMDNTYKVRYATATNPYGPFTEGANSPILVSDANLPVVGPGHHSIFSVGGQDYIAYHRHVIVDASWWMPNRNLLIDEITINNNGTINDVVPTLAGISGWGWRYDNNLARGKTYSASTFYNNNYRPAFAFDDNNSTRWAANWNTKPSWVQVDLGQTYNVKRVQMAQEFVTQWVQYKIEYSVNGTNWSTFADRTGSTDTYGITTDTVPTAVSARYIRVTITKYQDNGHWPSIHEIKVFSN